jgi:hypothetical protein
LLTGKRQDSRAFAAFTYPMTLACGLNSAASALYNSSLGWKLYLPSKSWRPNPRHVTSFIPSPTPPSDLDPRIEASLGAVRTPKIGEPAGFPPCSVNVALDFGEVVYASYYQSILGFGRATNLWLQRIMFLWSSTFAHRIHVTLCIFRFPFLSYVTDRS